MCFAAQLERGAWLNAKDKRGVAPVHLCAQWSRPRILQMLLEFDPEEEEEEEKTATQKRIEALKMLMGRGRTADPTAKNHCHWSAFHYAIFAGSKKCVEVLMEADETRAAKHEDPKKAAKAVGQVCDAFGKTKRGRTALVLARGGHEDIFKLVQEQAARQLEAKGKGPKVRNLV